MKKYLLLLVIALGISAMTTAQNYIGKKKKQILTILDDRGIDYELYYTAGGDEGIRYEADGEKRVYLIDVNGICHWYMVLSNNQDFLFKARRFAVQSGFIESSVGEDYTYTYRKVGSMILTGPCPDNDDTESAFYGWTFYMIYTTK